MAERVLVLDGSPSAAEDLAGPRRRLLDELERRGASVRLVLLRDETLAHCQGCFGCWQETPGLCRSRDASGAILEAMLGCDTLVLLTPVTAGGYGSTLKRLVDHWIQLALPFFVQRQGETHHPLRYGPFPRVVAIGVAASPDPVRERLFRTLVARNARNFPAPSCSAGILAPEDPAGAIRRLLDASLAGEEPVSVPEASPWRGGAPGRALLLVGSPKPGPGSSSAILGGRLLGALAARGWTPQTLALGPSLRAATGRDRLLQAAAGADLVLLACPLYIDALPCLATLALECLADAPMAGKGLAALVNSGFPEARQNHLALAMCAQFAREAGMAWAGGLALGGGGAVSGGARRRPPAGCVLRALDLAAEALAAGLPVPERTAALLAKSPIPGLPQGLWRRLYCFIGELGWRREARRNGADPRARPLAPGFN